ncbi:MAG: zinc-ribbon domain-containing protein [bacterium]|nr:zinc-ribbon domain-containing protein [bacterium]
MMFFIFGIGPHMKPLGSGEYRTCPRCNNHTRWQKVESCQRFSLFFIPVISWGKNQVEQCSICGEVVSSL